jgi:hypothetical protein
MQNLFVSDASDSHMFIYRADRQFLLVKEFEFSEEESSASLGYGNYWQLKKTLESDPEQSNDCAGGSVFC